MSDRRSLRGSRELVDSRMMWKLAFKAVFTLVRWALILVVVYFTFSVVGGTWMFFACNDAHEEVPGYCTGDGYGNPLLIFKDAAVRIAN